MKKVTRRTFVKIMAAVSATTFIRRTFGVSENVVPYLISVPQGEKEVCYAMVIDVGACLGCRQCVHACKRSNNVPDEPIPMAWIECFEMDMTTPVSQIHSGHLDISRTAYTTSPKEGKWYMSVNCYHCENPPCVKVCPVGATYESDDGIVEMDYDKCIGCRNCMAACPYNARRFNLADPQIPPDKINPLVSVRTKGIVEKCTFCKQRVREGRQPVCVEVCPVEARHFGNINDPESPVAKLLEKYNSFRLLDEMNTQPRIYYITSGKKWFSKEG